MTCWIGPGEDSRTRSRVENAGLVRVHKLTALDATESDALVAVLGMKDGSRAHLTRRAFPRWALAEAPARDRDPQMLAGAGPAGVVTPF